MIRTTPARGGFTLIELLVVMSLIAGLAALALIVAPGIMDKDRSADAVSQFTNSLQLSRARALRDGLPRGVRLIVDPTKPVTAGPPPVDQRLQVTEYQYIESPPVYVPNPLGPGGTAYVQFDYTVSTGAAGPPPGTVTARQVQILGLTVDQQNEIRNIVQTGGGNATLVLPTLGTVHKMQAVSAVSTPSLGVALTLDQYPDAQLGAQTNARTYHFGIYGPARPLLGEPTVQLPKGTCIDLSVSFPAPAAAVDYDILFGPSGQLVSGSTAGGTGQVFLWFRDPSKTPTMDPTPLGGYLSAGYGTALQKGGEQMIVAIKAKSGAVGAAPVYWPDVVSSDPFLNARKAVAGQ